MKLSMKLPRSPLKRKHYTHLTKLIVVSSSVCILYLLASLFRVHSKLARAPYPSLEQTDVRHLAFGIASGSGSWPSNKEYVRTWWNSDRMRGCVYLDRNPRDDTKNDTDYEENDPSLPPICISEDTSRFRYTFRNGDRTAIRVARIVLEMMAKNPSEEDVRWFVFGEDDTVFFPDNLAKTLAKYDHTMRYYVGTSSEIYEQNELFGFGMAFEGAGYALSYPMAKVLAKVIDSCIQRYAHLYGSDARVFSCITELGVQLTHEPGFHQIDIRGDMFGLLTSHPVTPLVSLHNLEHTDPIFPDTTSRTEALNRLFGPMSLDPQRILQRYVCYDKWFSWTVSVSWGYAVQIHGHHVTLPDLLRVPKTFRKWNKRNTVLSDVYTFATEYVDPDPCRRPVVFFLHDATSASSPSSLVETLYRRSSLNCSGEDSGSPRKLQMVRVLSHKLRPTTKQLQAPRRQCCDVSPSSAADVLDIKIRECQDEELIYKH